MRYRATVSYDGTHYYGFQRQREEYVTIQGELEKALYSICRQPVTITGSGRTDSGVHAIGQVIAFEAAWRHESDVLQRALNAKLPASIGITNLQTVLSDFHPRFSAKRRAYEYHVLVLPTRDPIQRLYKWRVRNPLDMVSMNEAASCLIGSQDFATFGQPPQGVSTIREVFRAEWQSSANDLTFYIEANAFLYRMVRSIVGSLMFVGEGRWTVAEFEQALYSQKRGNAGKTAPPHGLFLTRVDY